MTLSRRHAMTGLLGLGATVAGIGATATSAVAIPPGVRPASGDWSSFRRDAARTNWNPSERVLNAETVSGLAPRWSVALPSGQSTSAAIRIDDTLLHAVTAGRTWLFARSPASGAVRWRAALSSEPLYGTQLHGDRRVVAAGPTLGMGRRNVRVFARADGTFLWSTPAETFTVHAGALYTVLSTAEPYEAVVTAFDSLTGTQLWTVNLGESYSLGPVVADDRGVLALSSRYRSMLRPDGRVRWRRETVGGVSPLMFDGDVFTALGGKYEVPLARLGLLDGSTIWSQPSEGTHPRADFQAASQEAVLVTDGYGRIRRRDRVTGESAWQTDIWYTAGLTAAGSLLYVPDSSGGIVVRSIETGELVTRVGAADDAPLQVQTDGLFVSRGQLFAVGWNSLTSYAL